MARPILLRMFLRMVFCGDFILLRASQAGGPADGEYTPAGGMIGLKAEQGKVRLRINTSMVQTANVTVSSKLLRIATQR